MNERSDMLEWIRGELVGPARRISEPAIAEFLGKEYRDVTAGRRGPLAWRPETESELEEVLYYDRESPHRKYGAGMLHPVTTAIATSGVTTSADRIAMQSTDTIGADVDVEDIHASEDASDEPTSSDAVNLDAADDFEVTSPDVRHPSTIGVSFCAKLEVGGCIAIRLPRERRFAWQQESSTPFPVNGRYEACTRLWTDDNGRFQEGPMWRRRPAFSPNCEVVIGKEELVHERVIRREVTMPDGSPLKIRVEFFPRQVNDRWLLTVVLRNATVVSPGQETHQAVLYQCYFEVLARRGSIERYPESQRPFEQLDAEEQSLALLYRESATWGIGHGCAAGWDAEPGQAPTTLFADILPAVELPSMTPDITDSQDNRLQLSMRDLSSLSDSGDGPGWSSLDALATEYEHWIARRREQIVDSCDVRFAPVAQRHLEACSACLQRIGTGIQLLRSNAQIRDAFCMANLAMLLQQIATKQLAKRPLCWSVALKAVHPQGPHRSPWAVYSTNEESVGIGSWRAFQIAFLLMSLAGLEDGHSPDRDIVDLVWFPTGGGKTEAYLAVMAFYMFHERLLMTNGHDELRRDGTNVLMRYTLRMLTTQQFQRAASLICAMEFLRRLPDTQRRVPKISGQRFSLGLWLGGEGSPNKIKDARDAVSRYRKGDTEGNPLVLTECPWCRAQIGRFDGLKTRPPTVTNETWNRMRVQGIAERDKEPMLLCSDPACDFGRESPQTWLPVEVIDERIYRLPPSLVIGTADKFAMIAFRPAAGALFGRRIAEGYCRQEALPPGLIIQDELHLISGPLGTIYALYEGIFERLCSFEVNGRWIKPKIVASTATIRGAADQVRALYARDQISLFPSPGLLMGDSFFGTYARDDSGRLREGRLYLGIHASDYGSVLTAQVRAFSAALFRPYAFAADRRDPWWTLLVFYNSLRELGGAKTIFDSDIRSRLKFMFNREGLPHDARRNIRIVEELTSRLQSQAEIVGMMDRLSIPYTADETCQVMDACLASNIIEVGVDIDRLSLMGVVGQPKTTATYIQVTGRVGRRWWERPGLILTLYSPAKSRDRSHFEQFHTYHRRLYERVEPTSATPFALAAIQRALPGALLTWARQQSDAPARDVNAYWPAVLMAFELLRERCKAVQAPEDVLRSLQEMDRIRDELEDKWRQNPQAWEEFPQTVEGEYLMLWPGQFATLAQRQRGVVVPSSMRQVDSSAELGIHQGYNPAVAPSAEDPLGSPSQHRNP
jgi:hypothetical protein